MSSYIEKLSSHLIEKQEEKDTYLIFPNKRAGLFLREEFQRQLDKPGFLPQVYGIEEFISKLSGLQILNNVDLLFRFYSVYVKIEKGNKQAFSDFMNWAQVLLHDFNEIDQQLVDTTELFEYLQDIRDIEGWGREKQQSPTSLQINFNNFWRNAGTYYNALKSDLLDNNLAYSGLASRAVVDLFKKEEIKNLEKQHLVFAGFSALTAAETKIIDHLHKNYGAEILWDIDKYYLDNPDQEAGLFFRKNNRIFQQEKLDWVSDKLKTQAKKISIIGVPQQSGQAKIAGEIIKNSPNNGLNTAIVLADENLLAPLLQSLPTEIDAVNVTMGYPLANAPLYDFFQELIELFSKKAEAAFYHTNFLKVINNTYFQFLLSSEEDLEMVKTIEEKVYQNNLSFINLDTFKTNIQSIPVLSSLFEVNKVDELIGLIQEYISILKSYFIDHKSSNNQLELEYLLGFHQLITRILELKTNYPYLDNYKTFQVLFKQLVSNTTIDFEGEPLEGLQVMGMLETRNLDFENVLLLSANEGILPLGKTHNSFIPFDVKSKYQLPTHREKDAMFAYHFYHLLQGAKTISIIYNTEADELGSGEKSRFVTQIEEELKGFKDIELVHKVSEIPIDQLEDREVSIQKDERIMRQIQKKLKSGLSPTSLSTFLNCPLDYYYKYVLGLKEDLKVEKDIESSSLGSALHDSLEALYKPYVGKKVDIEAMQHMLSIYKGLLEASFLKDFNSSGISRGKNLLTKRVAEKYLERFLLKEKQRIQKYGPIDLIATEESLQRKIPFELNGKDVSFTIKGKVDRLDIRKGQLTIIDYKTGMVKPNELRFKELNDILERKNAGKALQLMTYALLCKDTYPNKDFISGIESLRSTSPNLFKLSIDGEPVLNEKRFEEFEIVLKRIVTELLSPEIPFEHNHDSTYCEFCGS